MRHPHLTALSACALLVLTAACSHKPDTPRPYGGLVFDTLSTVSDTPLAADDEASPACHLEVELICPARTDSSLLARNVRREVLAFSLGEAYADRPADEALGRYAKDYADEYRRDLLPLYEENKARNEAENDAEAWFAYTQELRAKPLCDNPQCLVYRVDKHEYRGGAHGMYSIHYLNFDATDGRRLVLKDVFRPDTEGALTERLLQRLMEKSGCRTTDELEEQGLLMGTDLYVSPNFRLGADSIYFLYNVYEIAPYSTGAIELALAHTEVADLTKDGE